MAKSYTIKIDGYWLEPQSIPAQSGVYCVYNCNHNRFSNTVTINELIYIGQSEDVRNRISNHEKLPYWKRYLDCGEILCYSFGNVLPSNLDRCEAAMIFKHQPPANNTCKNSFDFLQTTIYLEGKIKKLHNQFTV